MNAAIKKLNDLIVPYSVQGHNYFIQEIRVRSSQYLPCYKKSSGKSLGLSTTNKHLILSSETLPDIIMNAAIKKLNDLIVPYSVQGYNYFIQGNNS